MNRTTRSIFLGVGLLAAVSAGWFVLRSFSDTSRRDAVGDSTQTLPPEYRVPVYPDRSAYIEVSDSQATRRLGEAAAISFQRSGFEEVDSIRDGVSATTSLLALGDVQSYLAFRSVYGCTIKPSAQAVADQQYAMGKVPGIEESEWMRMSAAEKFEAVASVPESRDATVLAIAVNDVRAGAGQRGSIPRGYRAQGLNSGFAPPSPGLFRTGANTEWAWMEIPVVIAASDEVLLRLEFVRDPAVNAWIPHRATLLAPHSVNLPSIVF